MAIEITDAVVAGGFALGGVVVSSGFIFLNSWREGREQERRFAAEQQDEAQIRKATLVREAAVGAAQAWGGVVRADAQRLEQERKGSVSESMSPTVSALTDVGLNLNRLLVLPIGDALRERALRVDASLTEFRKAYADPAKRSATAAEVGEELKALLEAARNEGTV